VAIGVCGVSDGPWYRRHRLAIDVAIAVFFVLLDTATTLVGSSWWPTHPGPLAWAMLGLQAAACASLVFRRRAPITVVAVLAAFTLALTLLIWPAGALTPEHSGNVWAPFATVLAGYGPFFYGRNRRTAYVALAVLVVVIARPWQPSATLITIALFRTALGPLLALYFDARRRMVQALTERVAGGSAPADRRIGRQPAGSRPRAPARRLTHRTRGRGAGLPRRGLVECADRGAAVPVRGHDQGLRVADAGQAALRQPHAGRAARPRRRHRPHLAGREGPEAARDAQDWVWAVP
jgi:hypothetical protein